MSEFAWLIEKGAAPKLRYYAPAEPGEWTKDYMKACRFMREQDAQAFRFRHVFIGHSYRVRKHWLGED